MSDLVTPAWLHEHLGDVRVVDATVLLTFPNGEAHIESGEASYLEAHVPGAVFADLISAGFTDHAGEAPFAAQSSEAFAAAVGALGIGNDDTVVVYDSVDGIWATRLWWQFRFEGFDRVRVLDGGLAAWTAAGLPTDSGPVAAEPAVFTAHRVPGLVVSTEEVEAAGDDAGVVIIEALPAPAYARGHIPGAVNVPAASLVDEGGALKDIEALRGAFAAVGALDPGVRVLTYCGGGIAATKAAFALHELGVDAAIYDGSKNAWQAAGKPFVTA